MDKFSGEIYNEITENYCCGAYVNAKNVAKLKADYEADGEIKEAIDGFYAQNLPAFLDALNYAYELEIGLLEATEVVEPNPPHIQISLTAIQRGLSSMHRLLCSRLERQ